MTFVQGATNGATTSQASVTATFSAGVTTGNTVWGVVTWDFTTGSNISSVKVGTVSANVLDTLTDSTDTIQSATFILGNISGAPTTVTVNFSPNTDNTGLIVIEESGCLAAANPTDVHTGTFVSTSGTGANALSSGNVTTTTANDIIVGACQSNGTTTAATAGTSPLAFTLRNTFNVLGALPLVTEDGATLASAGVVAATFGTTSSSAYNVFVIAIKPAIVSDTLVGAMRALMM